VSGRQLREAEQEGEEVRCAAPIEESLRNLRPIGSQIRPFVCQFGWYAIRMADQKAPQEASLFPIKASPASVTTPQNGRIGSYFRNISGVAQAEVRRWRCLFPPSGRCDRHRCRAGERFPRRPPSRSRPPPPLPGSARRTLCRGGGPPRLN